MNLRALYESNKQRVLTGVLLLAFAIIIAIVDHPFVTWLIFGVLYMAAFYEAMNLFDVKSKALYIGAILLWCCAFFYPNPSDTAFIVVIIFVATMAYKKEMNYALLAPLFYPTISMLFLYTLYHDFGMSVLVWLVIVVASTDTGAYSVGKSIGKTSFSPTSPNKTLEGVIGGITIATVAGTLYSTFFLPIGLAALITILTSMASVFGDLFESYLKREAGVKDSGTLLPGHGGMLDRLDGYLFGVIVMVILLRGLA